MKQAKLHIGLKLVLATAMTRIEYDDYRGWQLPEDEKHLANEGGCLVEYIDGGKANHPDHKGYISWSPMEVFDNAYKASGEMSFGMAIEAAKRGYKVARIGWNGAKMYAVIMPGFPDGCPANEVTAAIHGIPVGTTLSVRPYWSLKTAQNDIAMWAPSGSDSLADDWVIVDSVGPETFLDRLKVEQSELREKFVRLTSFFDTDLFKGLSTPEQDLLREQSEHMLKYVTVLDQRISCSF